MIMDLLQVFSPYGFQSGYLTNTVPDSSGDSRKMATESERLFFPPLLSIEEPRKRGFLLGIYLYFSAYVPLTL